jgi:ABC-type lipopolysaccharide export system ATPase subunit
VISVENLTKRYATKTAIEGMSFNVEKGEILGFLGPNGAGKTYDEDHYCHDAEHGRNRESGWL